MTDKNLVKKIAIFALITIIGVLALFGAIHFSNSVPGTAAIKQVQQKMLGPNRFLIGETTVKVSSADDLGFKVNSTWINLYYGEVLIKIPFKCLKDEEFMDSLGEIGIKIYTRTVDEITEYKITYWDEPITEWSYIT